MDFFFFYFVLCSFILIHKTTCQRQLLGGCFSSPRINTMDEIPDSNAACVSNPRIHPHPHQGVSEQVHSEIDNHLHYFDQCATDENAHFHHFREYCKSIKRLRSVITIDSFMPFNSGKVTMNVRFEKLIPGSSMQIWVIEMSHSHNILQVTAKHHDRSSSTIFSFVDILKFYGKFESFSNIEKNVILEPFLVNQITFLNKPNNFVLHCNVFKNKPELQTDIIVFFHAISNADFSFRTKTVSASFKKQMINFFSNSFGNHAAIIFDQTELFFATVDDFDVVGHVERSELTIPAGFSLFAKGSGKFIGFGTSSFSVVISRSIIRWVCETEIFRSGELKISSASSSENGPTFSHNFFARSRHKFSAEVKLSCHYFNNARMNLVVNGDTITLESINTIDVFGNEAKVFIQKFNLESLADSNYLNQLIIVYSKDLIRNELSELISKSNFPKPTCTNPQSHDSLLSRIFLQATGFLSGDTEYLSFSVEFGKKKYESFVLSVRNMGTVYSQVLELIKEDFFKQQCPVDFYLGGSSSNRAIVEGVGKIDDAWFIHHQSNSFGIAVGEYDDSPLAGRFPRQLMIEAEKICNNFFEKGKAIRLKNVITNALQKVKDQGKSTALLINVDSNFVLNYASAGVAGLVVLRHERDDWVFFVHLGV